MFQKDTMYVLYNFQASWMQVMVEKPEQIQSSMIRAIHSKDSTMLLQPNLLAARNL